MIRLAVRCRPDQAEAVLAELLQLAPNGVEEERLPDEVEYAIYGGPGEIPELGELRAALGDSEVEVLTSSVPDDWADRWADFHRPIVVAERIRVRPSWWEREGEAIDVVIDPGQAFGTGAHATTRLCLELLVELADGGHGVGELADWGTGSGVLAIAAAKLGWSPVVGCDREPAALESARSNARENRVELELRGVDVREQAPPVAATVTANLTAPLLGDCARHLAAGGERPQALVCSGMLEREADEVATAFAAVGLSERTRLRDGEWSAALLQRGAGPGGPDVQQP